MYRIGDKVKVSSENDNDNYDSFRDKVLIVENIATSENDTCAYDPSMNGMQLMDFTTEQGKEVPFSLYEYEVEYA
jgi:hypothetical protein